MTEIQTVTAGAEARTSWSCPLTYLVSARRDRETGTQWRVETDSDLSALLSLLSLSDKVAQFDKQIPRQCRGLCGCRPASLQSLIISLDMEFV